MPTMKLTDAAVQRLKAPPGARVEYFDATLPGFGLRVAGPTPRAPEGRRSWVLFYRYGGQQKRLTIEPAYPAQSLADARKRAGDALALLSKGMDPSADKAETKVASARRKDTLANVLDEYLSRGMEKKARAPGYVAGVRRNFANHVLPRIGEREIKAIARRDIIAMLDDIAEAGTARRTANGKEHAAGGPIAANRVLAAVRSLFNWAIRRGLVEVNPCTLVERPGNEAPRERTLAADELRELWPQFEAIGYPFGPFLKLALITGQRRGEVAGMRWADLDLDAKTWSLGSDQTKAGRAHVVPLSDMAVAIITALPRKSMADAKGVAKPSPYVFTTEGDTPISGFSRAKQRVETKIATARNQAGVDEMEDWGVHDLRRTAATEMGRLGVAEFTIAKVLNHASRGITGQVYNRYEYLSEKRAALDTWAAYLDRLINPPAANVVALRAG